MKRPEYIEDIKISLGAPVVEIELTDDLIGKHVDRAFREVVPHITETRFMTLTYSNNGIDLKGKGVDTVVQIFRTRNPSRVGDLTDIYALSSLTNANSSSSNLLMSDYLYRTQLNQLKSTMSTDLDFTWDKESRKLYINTFFPKPEKLTLAYIPEFTDVSEITESYWINYIQRLSLAFVKEALGRVRSKYDLSSALYKLDGDTLISEGISERDAIRQELSENSDIVFPTD